MGLPAAAVKRPVLTTVLFLCMIFLGIVSSIHLPVELYQGLSSGIVSIIIRARGGLAPIEVERMITRQVEESVSTADRLKTMYSNSREGESRVTLEFEPGTDMNFASLEVREKFSRVKSKLPDEIEKPVVANYADSDNAVMIFAVISDSKSPEELRAIMESELKPLLERLNGVASIEIYGGRERKILIELDRDKMAAYNISIEEVMDIVGASNVNLLAGNYERGDYQFAIRTMGAFTSIDEIGNLGIKVTRQASVIPLKEIATVKDSYLEPEDYARLNLNQNISIYVKKISTANTIKVVEGVRNILKDYEKLKHEELRVVIVSDRAKSIKRAIDDVRDALLIGVLLVTGIIYLTLRRRVLALIIFTAIPVSVVSAFLFMDFFGFSINVMTLSGIALSIGILVDSSVVVMENVFKKMEHGIPQTEAVTKGAEEVWLPLVASLITNLIVFLPILFIDKEVQLQYSGFAFTTCITQILSLFVAIMLIPVLLSKAKLTIASSVVIASPERAKQSRDREIASLPSVVRNDPQSTFSDRLYHFYEKILRLSFRFRYLLLGAIALFLVVAIVGLSKRDIDLPSTLEENEFKIIIFPLAGAKLDTNDEAVKKIEELLRAFPEVDLISSTVRKDDVQVFVRLHPRSKRKHSKDEIMASIREKGNEAIKQIHEEYSLIVDEGVSSEEGKKIVVNIFGLENEMLEKLAHDFAKKIQPIPGLTNLVMTDLRKRPEYSLVVDRARASQYGLTVKDVANSVHAQIRGMRPTKYHELSEGKEIETITRLQPIYRQKIDDLRQLYFVSPKDGTQASLEQIASFYPSHGPQTIDRRNKYRYVFLKGDVSKPIETIGKSIKEAVRDIEMPQDYFWRFGGSYESLLKGKSQSLIALVITVGLIYMVLACFFQSYTEPFIIMSSIPLASIGVFIALFITGKPLSQNVFLGMILLAGYVVNNSIILIDQVNQLKASIPEKEELLVRAGKDRLRPILITTGATLLGFLPMVLSSSESSSLWAPLAITTIGGIISSTILTLFIVPNIFLYFDDFKKILKLSS